MDFNYHDRKSSYSIYGDFPPDFGHPPPKKPKPSPPPKDKSPKKPTITICSICRMRHEYGCCNRRFKYYL